MAGLISLLSLIANHGSIDAPFTNFAEIRKNQLTGLDKFMPDNQAPEPPTRIIHPQVQHVRAFGGLINHALRTRGGHLAAEAKKLFYVRIPKAANTSCSQVLLKVKFPDLPETLNAHQINLLTDCWLRHQVPASLRQYTGFTVVRHPLQRLVSVYRSFFGQSQDTFIYDGYLFGVLPKSLSFDDFVHRISRIPDSLKDQHCRPQACFLEAYRKKKVPVQVFKLEQVDALKDFLTTFSLEIRHLNQGALSYDYRSYYSARSLETARKMYASDFKLFKYDQ